ncbi:hypothetical protein A2U01_0059680, partial [Trifolium medium]|nr:hypothetical protein [Trifolium medium]
MKADHHETADAELPKSIGMLENLETLDIT